MFFKKVTIERSPLQVLCMAPGGWDKLILLHHTPDVYKCVLDTVNTIWSDGISKEKTVESQGETLQEIKMNGCPWNASGDESTASRILLMTLIANLSKIGWKFHAAVNIKGGTDSLFFINMPHEVIVVVSHREELIQCIALHRH
jgi:hypothetical protein